MLFQGAGHEDRTELYLKLAVNAVNKGKSVLYLVPGIAVSALLEKRVREVFPEVSIYHSGQTAAKKRDIVLEARQGEPADPGCWRNRGFTAPGRREPPV